MPFNFSTTVSVHSGLVKLILFGNAAKTTAVMVLN
jgi:hypothetical protein